MAKMTISAYSRLAVLAVALVAEALPGACCAESLVPGMFFRDCLTCPWMVVVPKGSFMMGQDLGAGSWEPPAELPRHKVTIAANFAISEFPVTQGVYLAFMGKNPSFFTGNLSRPVEQVSWTDTKAFIAALNKKTSKSYRLPSEAEWEYVARAGTQTPYFFSTATSVPPDPWPLLGNYAWYLSNAGGTTHPVGQLMTNPFGLSDIYGNVWQWVQDCWHNTYYGAPTDGSAWTTGTCTFRIKRGGSWVYSSQMARSAARDNYSVSAGRFDIGFRIVRGLAP